SVGVAVGEVCDGAQLMRAHDPVRNSDAHHETLQCAPHASLAAGNASTVALGVNAPPAEVGADPLGRDRIESLTRKAAYLVQSFPRIHGTLKALRALRRGFFFRFCRRIGHVWGNKKPTARLVWRWVDECFYFKKKFLSQQPPRARAHASTTTTTDAAAHRAKIGDH